MKKKKRPIDNKGKVLMEKRKEKSNGIFDKTRWRWMKAGGKLFCANKAIELTMKWKDRIPC